MVSIITSNANFITILKIESVKEDFTALICVTILKKVIIALMVMNARWLTIESSSFINQRNINPNFVLTIQTI